ncbi:MAG: 5'/3'-nucleotidase SurE [Bacteroides sp.]|nr:5'/3'-nucleotidase SurE [Bacteroides sp.]
MNNKPITDKRPLILVSNDDGITANGVHELVDCLVKFGDVVTVCPDAPRSGQSMAITVNTPLRIDRLDDFQGAKMYKINGTPVDCIKLAMYAVLDRKPDLVVSGINHGSNAAINVVYSGTMGAAFEGCALGVPSIAFSLTSHDPDADMKRCIPFVEKLVSGVLEHGLPEGVCLNVNIPAKGAAPEEMRLTKGCKGKWTDEYQEYTDPQGKKFWWLTGSFENDEPNNEDTDEWCLAHGIVSVVPTLLYRTAIDLSSLEWIEKQ